MNEFANGGERRDGVGAGRLINGDRRRGDAVEPGLAIEVGGAQLQARDIAEAQDRAVRIGADDDVFELRDGRQTSLGLNVELELLVVGNGPRADAPDRRLSILGLDGVDDVARGEAETGQPVGSHPGAHRIVLRPPQRRVADAGGALDLIEQIDRDVIGEEQRIVGVLRRIDRDDAEQRRRFLLDRHALALHLRRELRQRDLHAIVDIDRVDVRIGSEFE